MCRIKCIGAACLLVGAVLGGTLEASVLYNDGLSPVDATLFFGNHLVSPETHPSVAGTGGSGISNNGDALNGDRTYTYDQGAAADLADGVANRGDAGFAMLIWDMVTPFDSMRLYTHQDHIRDAPNAGPLSIVTDFVAQDVMEYSVWGSHDGDSFVLLSDVVDYNITGGGVGRPTYVFAGTEPSIVYRSGSAEEGEVNAYTREYVFPSAYRYYGIRTSTVSLFIPDHDAFPGGQAVDADPEIDAVAGFNISDRPPGSPGTSNPIPEPSSLLVWTLILGSLATSGLKRRGR